MTGCRQLLPWDYFPLACHPGVISTGPISRSGHGKNGKRTYGEAVAAIFAASAGTITAPAAPQPAGAATNYETIPAAKGRADDDDLSVGGGSGFCLKTAGTVRANELVRRYLKVSPATHPPCNAENACSLIRDEIKRGCALLGAGAPDFCGRYKDSVDQKPARAGFHYEQRQWRSVSTSVCGCEIANSHAIQAEAARRLATNI